jgi:predicted nucleotidyltransferase
MPGVFINFASSRFLNRDRVICEVQSAVEAMKSDRSDVKEIYLFGSFASGVPTPKSDIDLLIVTEASAETFLPHFSSIPVPVDIHVITPEIFRTQKQAGKGIVREAVNRGIRLL